MDFNVSYVTTLPNINNSPSLSINKSFDNELQVNFYIDNNLVYSKKTFGNEIIEPRISQCYENYYVEVLDEFHIIFSDEFDVQDKNVFIKFDSYALGDTIAWFAYVDYFRAIRNCKVICSTFHNELFEKAYPNITFVPPNTKLDNIYFQVYVGSSSLYSYSKTIIEKNNLQQVIINTLGLNDYVGLGVRPLIHLNSPNEKLIDGEYIVLSLSASGESKMYGDFKYWSSFIDNFLTTTNHTIILLGFNCFDEIKEKYAGEERLVFDYLGRINYPLLTNIIKHSDLFIGFSSGLTWLSWALDVETILISYVTPFIHEPSDVIRYGDENLTCVDYENKPNEINYLTVKKLNEDVISRLPTNRY